MPWRCRYFEINHYRPLLKEYFRQGARWSAAPKPQLSDALYAEEYAEPKPGEPYQWVVNDFEPTFDAADFLRCGRDLFYFKSHVTNAFGVQWLARHLGPEYRLHELHCDDAHRMHIDTTFLPLAPGKMLVNPERVERLPQMFRHWDMLKAPPPCTPSGATLYFSSGWLSMNVLSIDPERVVVAEHEESLIRALKDWGFKPIPCPFQAFYAFGGSIHCATLDVRRRGTLQSYF
jgi:glycine amidinotransferase